MSCHVEPPILSSFASFLKTPTPIHECSAKSNMMGNIAVPGTTSWTEDCRTPHAHRGGKQCATSFGARGRTFCTTPPWCLWRVGLRGSLIHINSNPSLAGWTTSCDTTDRQAHICDHADHLLFRVRAFVTLHEMRRCMKQRYTCDPMQPVSSQHWRSLEARRWYRKVLADMLPTARSLPQLPRQEYFHVEPPS